MRGFRRSPLAECDLVARWRAGRASLLRRRQRLEQSADGRDVPLGRDRRRQQPAGDPEPPAGGLQLPTHVQSRQQRDSEPGLRLRRR